MTEDPKKKRRRSRRAKLRRRRRMPINVAASVITTIALYCGIASIFSSIRGQYDAASYWILGAIIFDSLDGTVARMTKSVSDFGKELDSLGDIVSFGVAPAVLVYKAYFLESQASGSSVGPAGGMVCIIYVIFGALRLARYNVFQADRQDVFFGLPIPGAAGTIAAFTLFSPNSEWQVAYWVMSPLILGLSFLMVSTIRYPKKSLGVFVLTPRKGFRMLVFVVMGIAVIHYAMEYSLAIVLFPLGLTYVLFGPANEILAFTTRRKPLTTAEPTATTEVTQP